MARRVEANARRAQGPMRPDDVPPDPFDSKKYLFEQYAEGVLPQAAFQYMQVQFGPGSLSLRACHDYFFEFRRQISRKRARRAETPPMEPFKIRRVVALEGDAEPESGEESSDDSEEEEDIEIDVLTVNARTKAEMIVQNYLHREVLPGAVAGVDVWRDQITLRIQPHKLVEFRKVGAKCVITDWLGRNEIYDSDYIDMAVTTLITSLKTPALKINSLFLNLKGMNGYDDQSIWATFLTAFYQSRRLLPDLTKFFVFDKPDMYDRIRAAVPFQRASFRCNLTTTPMISVIIDSLEDAERVARTHQSEVLELFAEFTF